MKKCSGPCKLTKSTSEFHKKTRNKDRLQSRCKTCIKSTLSKRYENNVPSCCPKKMH